MPMLLKIAFLQLWLIKHLVSAFLVQAILAFSVFPFLQLRLYHFRMGILFLRIYFRSLTSIIDFLHFNLVGAQKRTIPPHSLSGELDPSIASDLTSFSFTPVSMAGANSFNYWKLPLQSLTVDSTDFPLSSSLVPGVKTPVAVLDSGTTLILGPASDVDAFWYAIDQEGASRKNTKSGLWEVRCNLGVSVSFLLGEKGNEQAYPVDPSDINWKEGGSEDGWCMGGIQANDGVTFPSILRLHVSQPNIIGQFRGLASWRRFPSSEFFHIRVVYAKVADAHLENVYVTHHLANSTHQPLIGLLSMTDPSTSMLQFRSDRGTDQPPSSRHWTRNIASVTSSGASLVCSVSSASGFVIGVIITLLVRIRRNRSTF